MRRSDTIGSLGWIGLTVLATAVGVVSLRYVLPDVPFPAKLSNFVTHRTALCVHAGAASIALLVGPWQFATRLRNRHIGVHRLLGRCYVLAVLIGWAASVVVALHAQTGRVASAGFLALGLAWVSTTMMAVWKIVHGDVMAHRRWMIRSFALTAAAITLRVYLGAALALHASFVLVYPMIAWLCWVPNVVVTEIGFRNGGGR